MSSMIKIVIRDINAKPVAMHLIAFTVLFFAACANYHFFLTNVYTPGGDGGRIYQYLMYMEKVPEVLPFWNSHKHHGYPFLAEPENFMPLALVLNTESPYFNIQLNIIFVLCTTLFAFACRTLARFLGMTQIAALFVGVFVILTVPSVRLFMHGTFVFLFDLMLMYAAIVLICVALQRANEKHVYLFIPALLMLSWVIRDGYYLPVVFHVPAFVILTSLYLKSGKSLYEAGRNSVLVLLAVSVVFVLLSMPYFLPILDGVLLSSTFEAKAPVISISTQSVYNYTLSLWPFIVLALIYTRGLHRRYAYLFAAMAAPNYVLIFFDYIQFDLFFNAWKSTPVLKNIRWQYPFNELSSMASVFCAGLFLDACRKGISVENRRIYYLSAIIFVSALISVAFEQYRNELYLNMFYITILFIMLIISSRSFITVVVVSLVIAVMMGINLTERKSPFGNRLYTAKNSLGFIKPNKNNYFWWNGSGFDEYTTAYNFGKFSIVFMKEYRMLLSLLYQQDITAQRPHWIKKIDKVRRFRMKDNIAHLMAIVKPSDGDKIIEPFRMYDEWVVASDDEAVGIMRQENFTPLSPIILDRQPGVQQDSNVELQYASALTGKSADMIKFNVSTNKNSILFVPEIYHRDWHVTVNGQEKDVLKAYATMRAVALPPGDHEIVFRFIYMPFWWGLLIASVTLVLLCAFLYRFRKKTKAEGVHSEIMSSMAFSRGA